jgi:hypothetical protein
MLDWFDTQDPRELFVLALGIVVVLVVAIIVLPTSEDGRTDARPNPPPLVEERPTSVEHTNRQGGYGFDYPARWDAMKSGTLSRLESPNGRIIMTFEVGAPGTLNASDRMVESLGGNVTIHELIGTQRERIAGAPSLLASGIGEDETGKRIRFLAISVRGQLHTYEISIVVPVGSEPRRLLPRLEEIVSSFEILGPSLF